MHQYYIYSNLRIKFKPYGTKKTKQVKNFSSSKIILFPNDHQFITLSIIINDFPPWILVQIVHRTRPNHSALWYHSIFQWYYFLSTLYNDALNNSQHWCIPTKHFFFFPLSFFWHSIYTKMYYQLAKSL